MGPRGPFSHWITQVYVFLNLLSARTPFNAFSSYYHFSPLPPFPKTSIFFSTIPPFFLDSISLFISFFFFLAFYLFIIFIFVVHSPFPMQRFVALIVRFLFFFFLFFNYTYRYIYTARSRALTFRKLLLEKSRTMHDGWISKTGPFPFSSSFVPFHPSVLFLYFFSSFVIYPLYF